MRIPEPDARGTVASAPATGAQNGGNACLPALVAHSPSERRGRSFPLHHLHRDHCSHSRKVKEAAVAIGGGGLIIPRFGNDSGLLAAFDSGVAHQHHHHLLCPCA